MRLFPYYKLVSRILYRSPYAKSDFMNVSETPLRTILDIMGNTNQVVRIENGMINGEKSWFQNDEDSLKKNVIVICGPSGSGKSTLLKLLMNEYPECFGFSISHTTRKPRVGEHHGKDYHYVSREEFQNAIDNGEFLEYTEFSGNIYGTSKKAVNTVINNGRICILDIEIEGVKNMKKTDFEPRYVFIKPPSIQVLEERLRGRGTETEESIQKRLSRAKVELAYGETPGNFDVILVNNTATETYQELKKFLIKDIENLRRKQYQK